MKEEQNKSKQAKFENENVKDSYYIVGIGASAGGLEALQQLLEVLPPNTGFPYIIVQHLSPDYKSLLAEILSKYTKMPLYQATNGMDIQPNSIYLIPPKNNMELRDNKLYLTEHTEGALNHPIDIFFRSLAKSAGRRAISVILSGTGSDGSNGIRDIKEQDGMIIVQKVESAKFDGMPKSALRTGLVDAELTPAEIAKEIQHIALNARAITLDDQNLEKLDINLTKRIYYILKKVSNVNFTYYKQTTIARRIERRMVLTHKESLPEYVDYLYENPEEVRILSKEVLIGVTSFFRDPEYFNRLKETAIMEIIKNCKPDEIIRVWVAGCSTGEEAYSLAILFSECMEELRINREVKIFATDLDVESIAIAGKGIYGESISDTVTTARLARYFVRKNNAYMVNRDIRKMIVFSPHNVFQDPPFGKLDLVSCRNMLIYFQPVLQRDLFSIFHVSLKDKGYLFLGKSEALGEYNDVFVPVDSNAKIFRHQLKGQAQHFKNLPQMQNPELFGDDSYFTEQPDNNLSQNSDKIFDSIDTTLLESFMPACFIVNDRYEIVHTYGENSNYLHFSVGKASLGLFDTLTDDLKIAVSTILKDVIKCKHKVGYSDIHIKGEHTEQLINLTALPLGSNNLYGEDLYAIVLSENTQRGFVLGAKPYQIDIASAQRITDLEQELKDLQAKLNNSISEQETVNEELQAANEELLTANEELQSSNEELQSVNEELYTVNAEYQQKLSEVADMNDDLSNFLSTTLIGIMFVDNALNIRRYTNYISSEFGIMEHDIGRSLRFIAYNFIDIDLVGICNSVLKTLVPVESEVLSATQKSYFLRIAPYRTTENKILGCVLTLVDLSQQKAEQKLLKSANVALSMAQKANDAKSDFLSRMSHEIRTPMNAIIGMAEYARRHPDDINVLAECVEKTSRAATYMNSIVGDILEMSKISQTQIELNYNPFTIKSITDNIEVLLDSQVQTAGLSFAIHTGNSISPLYFGDETRVQQMLINFLTNSIKYTPRGGRISLSVDEMKNVDGRAEMRFIVEDNGIGIKKEFIPELFKAFTRETRSESAPSSVGLGLSIAQNLVELMKGRIDVESEEGKGSKFTIYILLDTINNNDKKKVVKGEYEKVQYDISGLNILVVEDNDLNREMLVNLLRSQGAKTMEARDGKEALIAFTDSEPFSFDCILMDIRMPRMDGREATMAIRASARLDSKKVPIIGVSAEAFAEDIHKSRSAGIDDYIVKPIDTNLLYTAIDRLCRKKKK